ncbi:hypothetical protein [Evansella halocellulosilytica]|uniref:hypothetical protein n=1 Tax=Evansella halocellulosilytica TaxID=2011013 RepID=UPI00211C6336|nr:hypothetical protein [Evansella halocellulosilytica]
MKDLNDRLKDLKERMRKHQKWQDHIDRSKLLLSLEEERLHDFKLQLEKEKEDVERLENFTLTNIFYSITGKKLEKIDKEKQEVAEVKLKYSEAKETVEDLQKEIAEYNGLLATFTGYEAEYHHLLEEKEKLIHDQQSYWSHELYELTEQEAELKAMKNEYEEAIEAGLIADNKVDLAIQSLSKAKNWSTVDLFGGGMITTAVKHSHLDTAKNDIHEAQKELRHFQDELKDIEDHFNAKLNMGNFLTFADYFFNSLIVDWMVHGKINDSLDQVEKAKSEVSAMMLKLKSDIEEITAKIEDIAHQRIKMIESAT